MLSRSALVAGSVPASAIPLLGNGYLPTSEWIQIHKINLERASADRPRVVFLGDSTAYKWGDRGRLDAGSAEWSSWIAPLGAANFGIIGDLTQSVLWRVEHGELSSRPRLVVLQVGVNNLSEGDSTADTTQGITAVVRAIRRACPTTKVLVLGVLPTGVSTADPSRAKIRAINAQLARLASMPGVSFLDPGLVLLDSEGAVRPGLMIDRNFHPTAAGYRLMAEVIAGPVEWLAAGGKARIARH